MRVALLADVHGNLPAVEAVLAEARRENVDVCWNLGDLVGYGPFPDETVCRLRAEGVVSIRGNYDRKVLAFPRKRRSWRKRKDPRKYLAFGWAYEQLSVSSRDYLANLPAQRSIRAGGLRLLLTHGSPAADDEALSPDTPPSRLAVAGSAGPGRRDRLRSLPLPISGRGRRHPIRQSGKRGTPGG